MSQKEARLAPAMAAPGLMPAADEVSGLMYHLNLLGVSQAISCTPVKNTYKLHNP